MPDRSDPFYVGYLPLPSALRPFVKVLIAIGVLGAVAMAGVLATGQKDPGPGQWDVSTTYSIEGHLSVNPYPLVFVEDPDSPFGTRAVILVGGMKFGADERAAPLAGSRVRAKGQFISREGRGLFELSVDDDALVAISDQSTPPAVESLGEHSLAGEITDSKCFLGVMKPGSGKTHRACAVRCISGGIPPIFVTRDESGEATIYLLTDSSGGAVNEAVLPYVAEPLDLTGRLERHGDLLVYAIDTERIVRR